jgi:hypothetical protein
MKYLFTLLLAVSISTIGFSQEEEAPAEKPKLEVSGFVDVYFQSNFNGVAANTTAFTPDNNSFSLGMAKVALSQEFGKVSFGADLAFGPRAEVANGYPGTTLAAIQQLYVAYSPTDKLTLTAGNFGTHVGYELIDANLNFHYSTSYMFSYGPFYHTGLKADYAINDNFGVMVGIFDDTDSKFDEIAGKNYGAQLSYSGDVGDVYLNYLGGKDGEDSVTFNQVDLTASFGLSDKLSLGVNSTIKATSDSRDDSEASWLGAALYLSYEASEKLSIGVRGEYLGDADGVLFGTNDLSLIDLTASANIKIGALTIIPEFRVDIASDDFFVNSDGDFLATSPAVIVAAVYSF